MNDNSYYIQIEAVNIYASVYDTSQLSVVRGGSLLLKLAVELLGVPVEGSADRNTWPAYQVLADFNETIKRLNNDGKTTRHLPQFEPPNEHITRHLIAISTGASSAIYKVAGEADAAGLATEIRKYLAEHAYLRHFTFTVVAEPAADDFSAVKERLIAASRLQQLRQLSIAPDPDPERVEFPNTVPCHLQGIRAATGPMELPPKPFVERQANGIEPWLSAACAHRFWFGRFSRHALYRLEAGSVKSDSWAQKPWWEGNEVDVTESFDQIADTGEFPQLENKIAVFYADGDGFSGLQRDHVKTTEDQKIFDRVIKGQRRKFLLELMERWYGFRRKKRKTEREDNAGAPEYLVPLETLLWGGDELVMVVPASKGFELAQAFYSFPWTLEIPKDSGTATIPLTYSGGLVFCHYKAPIRKVRKLAQELADRVKEQRDEAKREGRAWEGSHFDYAVLESIDYPAEPLDAFFRKRYGPLAAYRFPLRVPFAGPATNTGWEALKKSLQRLLAGTPTAGEPAAQEAPRVLPKSQAYGLARAALAGDYSAEAGATERNAEQETSGLLAASGSSGIVPVSLFHRELRRFNQLRLRERDPCEDPIDILWNHVVRPPVPAAAPVAEPSPASAPASEPDLALPALARWQWLHLVELWDYLAPVRDPRFQESDATEVKP